MAKADLIELEGTVTKVIKGGKYNVEVDVDAKQTKLDVTAHLGGKLKLNKINVILGDRVTVMVSPYDLNRGTITYRHRK